MVLRSLGEAAHKKGSKFVAFGTRSLAVATGSDFSTVATVLRRLAAQDGGWVDLLEPAHGEKADLYELTIPADLAEMASDLRWDKGKAYGLRPVFRELGHVAAFVFEAVEAGRASSITELVPATGLSRSAVFAAVDTLAAYGLLERSSPVHGAALPGAGLTALVAHPDRLLPAAEMVGALDAVVVQLRRYAHDRQVWHAFLTRFDPAAATVDEFEILEDYWWPPGDAMFAGELRALESA